MFIIFFGEIVCFIIFGANIFLIICNGVNDDLLSKALFSGSLLLVLTPVSVMYLIDIHKRKKLLNYLKNHSVKAKCRILDFFYYPYAGFGRNQYKYRFHIGLEYDNKVIFYHIQTNNKKAEKYKTDGELPICFLPAYCEFFLGRKTKRELFKEIGVKFNLNSSTTFPMIIFEDDLYKEKA